MKKITSWVVAAPAMAVLAACEVTVNDNADGGTTGSAGSGSSSTSTGGSAGSSSTSTTSTGTGCTGGAGGSDQDSGGTCAASATAKACELCAFDKCKTEVCACEADTDCKGARDDYFTCVSSLDGGDM